MPRGFMVGGGRGGPHAMIGRGEKAKDVGPTLHRIWGYMVHHKVGLWGVGLLVLATTGFTLIGPYLLGVAIDEYILVGDIPGLIRISLLMAAAYAMAALTTWLQTYVMITLAQRTVRNIRKDLFAKLQILSLRFFDGRTHGELMSRLSNDVDNISNVLSQGVTQLISSALTIVGVGVVMMVLNYRLALVSLVAIPIMLYLTKWVAKRTRKGFREQQKNLGILNGIIEETITGQRVVKAFGREDYVIDNFDGANVNLKSSAIKAQTFTLVLMPFTNFVNNLAFVIVVAVGGWMAFAGLATIGTIASFINYSRQFARPLSMLANMYNTIQSAIAGAERVFETIDEVPDVVDVPDAHPLGKIEGHVELRDVCFGYEKDIAVLKNVSLEAQPGQTIALVGPTGAGKTTIVNLLTRFYDIDSGAILVDGHDIREVRKDDLRRQMGIVLQDTFLFAESVMENIRYGRLDATEEEVVAAAKLANADQFIHRLPEGYNTVLAEEGGNLSQGQRQLVAISRAVLADPSVLVLDEATSSVDTRTEVNIQEAMLRLMEGRTSFVIAHRLSTIREADNILVINDGEIIERGSHEKLLEDRGFYHNLYMSQFSGQLQVSS